MAIPKITNRAALDEAWKRIAQRFANGGQGHSGVDAFDNATKGVNPGDMAGSFLVPGYGVKDDGFAGTLQGGFQTAIDPGGFFKKTPYNTFEAKAAQSTFAPQGMEQYQQTFNQGVGQSNDLYGQQSAYADTLRDQIAGNGPSLAQGQLRTATDRINAQAAGLAASQRGMSPALAARQALQAQAANNQSAAGQSAMIRSQEQLAATGMLGQALAGQRAGSLQQAGLGSQGFLGTQQLAQQTAAQNAQNAMEAQRINADISMGNSGTAKSTQGNALGTVASIFMADGGAVPRYAGGGVAMVPTGNAAPGMPMGVSSEYANAYPALQQVLMGILAGIVKSKLGKKKDGAEAKEKTVNAEKVAEESEPSAPSPASDEVENPNAERRMEEPRLGASMFRPESPLYPGQLTAPTVPDAGADPVKDALAWTLPLESSPYGRKQVADFDKGGMVPGRAPFRGDDPRNDRVPALLSSEEVVLPRSVTLGPDAPERAAGYMKAIQATKTQAHPAVAPTRLSDGGKVGKPYMGKPDYSRLLKRQQMLARQVEELAASLHAAGDK